MNIQKLKDYSETIDSILLKTTYRKPKIKHIRILSFKELYSFLTVQERVFIQSILKINPKKFGFKGKFFGYVRPPQNIKIIKKQRYTVDKEVRVLEDQFLPLQVYRMYVVLNAALKKETGKILLVQSGYRSPAYQVLIFLHYLRKYQYDFVQTSQRVAIPGYSEHGYPAGQAVDFMTTKNLSAQDDVIPFDQTIEYAWLLENAKNYKFALSYPKKNALGMIFEPWHWHYVK